MVSLESMRCQIVFAKLQMSFKNELDESEQLALNCAQTSHDFLFLETEAQPDQVEANEEEQEKPK